MRNFKTLVAFFSLFVIGCSAFAQKFTNRGTEFWVGYGHHQYMEYPGDNSQGMVLYFYTGNNAAVVTVRLEGSGNAIPAPVGGPWTRTYTIPANTVISIEDPLPPGVTVTKSPNAIPAIGPIPKGSSVDAGFDARLYTCPPPSCSGGEGVFKKKGIHITSTAPIVAYAHIYGGVSSGATMLMPVETWGYNYTSVNSEQQNADNAYSWMYIVSNHDNTWVRITPSVPSRNGRLANVSFDTVLNRGEIYQLVGRLTSSTAGFNLTGTTVRSIDHGTGICYPVAVFAGSSRTGGEDPCAGGGRDNDMQQMFPEQAWGKRYLTAPFSNSGTPSSLMNCVYKVAVIDPATVVKRNGVPLTGLIGNKYYKIVSATADYIEANKPIMVAQFMGGGCVSGDGDPEMVYLSPIEQAIDSIGFYRNTRESINTQYLTLIIPTAGVSSLKIDNTLFSAISSVDKYSYPHPALPGYTVCIKRWDPATKGSSIVSSDSAYTAVTYGEGGAESYAYNAGTYVNNLNALTFIKNQLDTAKQSKFTCTDTKVNICALVAYLPTQIIWRFSQVANLSPNTGDVTTGDGVNLMVPSDSTVVNGRTYYQFCAPGNPYVFNALGTYIIPFEAKDPNASTCNPFEKFELSIDVKQKPVANFSAVIPSCPTDSVKFTGAGSGGGYTIGQWFWEFPQGTPGPDSLQNTGYIFPGPGTYNVKLTVASIEGCTDDTVKTVTVAPGASTSFTVSPTSLCQGGNVTISPGPTSTTEWYWDFGDGSKDTTYNGNPFTHTYTAFGTFLVGHSIKTSGSCNASAPPQTVTVHATPFATFSINPPGCLPANGVVQFSSTASAPDGQAINGHLWGFGDPNATPPANPNSSTLANPTHQYSGVGTYTITYRTTTVDGCFKDTSVQAIFNVTPAVAYSALTDVCLSDAPLNINTGTVTNSVPHTEYYSGPGITNAATGLFDPAIAGLGTHTIWYHATSTAGGCTDSVSQTIDVTTVANTGFTFPTGCLPNGTVQFTNNNTAGVYNWDFGEPSSGTNNTSALTNPQHTYSAAGVYNVKLSVTGGSNCIQDSTITITVKIKPILAYPPLSGVCGNAPAFSIASATLTNTVTGSGIYSGAGTTAAGIFDPAVAGIGTHIIWYIYTTTFGCIDSVSSTITVNPIPVASFTAPSGCLPNSTIQFTNNSTTGLSYTWDFGDGSATSSAFQPSHIYSGSGPYSVKLTADDAGCSKDTTIAVTVRVQPQLAYPPLSAVCGNVPAYSIATGTVINGVTGVGIYSGAGTTSGGMFDPSLAGIGTHVIKFYFTSTLNCIDSVSNSITVKAVPVAGFTFPTTCLPNGTVQFGDTSKPVLNPNTKTYQWNFGDASATGTTASPSHTYSGSGPYQVKQVVALNGCSDSVTMPVTVRVQPILSYPALTAVCGNIPAYSIATGTVINGVTGVGTYSGAGTTLAGVFDPYVAGVGTHVIKFYFTSTLGCADSIASSIIVKPVPDAGFTYPTTCLPNGAVQFGDTSKPVLNPNTKTYQWNFGDASATGTTASPSHTYSGSGPYQVRQVVSLNGCSDSTTVPVTVRIQPILSYPALAAVCGNVPAYSIATGTVTNGVTGVGTYGGAGTTSAGMFNPAIAGVGTHVIKFYFTSTLGCTDSVASSITVKTVPDAGFTFPTTCLPNGVVQFGDTSKPVLNPNTKTYQWNFGDASAMGTTASPSHTYTGSGPYQVRQVVSLNGCSDSTTVPVTVRIQPILSYPALAAVCGNVPAYSIASGIVTNSVTGVGTYNGMGTTSGGMFNPSIAGLGIHVIKFYFTSTLGCTDSIASSITVKAVPDAGFTFPTSCLPNGAVQFGDTSKPVLNPNTKAYQWNFGDASATVTTVSPLHVYSTAGTYQVKQVVSLNGCSDSVKVPVAVRIQPILAYPPLAAVCANTPPYSIATASVTNGVAKLRSHYNGPGITDTTLGIFNPAKAGVGTHTIRFYFTSSFGCTDSIDQTIVVKIVPVASFTYPTGCLTSNAVQFVSNGSTGTYLWNFGDPGLGTNTSTLANPVHNYTAFKAYSISLIVTANGCSDDTTITTTFRLQPVISFSALSPVCEANDTVSIAKAVITNAVPAAYPGKYSGIGVFDTLGLFNPAIAGPGTHTITFTYTSLGGCIATQTSSITVWPKPVTDSIKFNNSIDSNICINISPKIKGYATIQAGYSIVDWRWSLGNKDTLIHNDTGFVYKFDSVAAYKIKLVTVSNRGCASDTFAKFVFTRALPQVGFNSPAGICMPNGSVQFENTTIIAHESLDSLKYIWNFGDGSATSAATSPVHVYNSSQTKAVIILSARSPYGCSAADTANILFYAKPVANFAIVPSDICQGKPVTFTNLTTSVISSSTWDFGDGSSTSTAVDPVVTYKGYGNYQAMLVVVSNNGCRDTASRKVQVHLQPIADAGKSFVVDAGTAVTFQAVVNATNFTYQWSPATGLNSATILNPTITALTDQTYYFTATGDGGCSDTDSLTVTALFPLRIPNAFSPNNDGVNDTWDLKNLKNYPTSSVEVFNRYGQSVFLSNGRYTKSWDGTFKGNVLPAGTYYYIIDLKNGKKPVAGYVAIIK